MGEGWVGVKTVARVRGGGVGLRLRRLKHIMI